MQLIYIVFLLYSIYQVYVYTYYSTLSYVINMKTHVKILQNDPLKWNL